MLKPYSELVKLDVTPYCDTREAIDENRRKIQVPYLNWAKCIELLHENGAEVVYYEPLINEKTGSTLFMCDIPFVDEKKRVNRCFEVRVRIVIDDLEFIQNYPLMNGMYVVRDDTINQLRVSNAQARAFVKGVAIRTGLGFGLWLKEDETTKMTGDDIEFHSSLKIKERLEREITKKLDEGWTLAELAQKTNIGNEDDDVRELLRTLTKIYNFEGQLRTL